MNRVLAAASGLAFSIVLQTYGSTKDPDPLLDRPCSRVSIDAPGGPFEHYAFEAQGDVGDCYAFMSAKLTDAWRFKNEIDRKQSSGLALAMVISASDPLARDLNGQFGCEALMHAVRGGGCALGAVQERMGGRDPEVADELARLLRLYRRMLRKEALYEEEELNRFKKKICKVSKKLLGSAGDAEMDRCEIEDALYQKTGTKFLYELLLRDTCEKPENKLTITNPLMTHWPDAPDVCYSGPLATTSIQHSRIGTGKEAALFAQKESLAALDRALDAGKPAGIGFCSTFLRHPGTVAIDWHRSFSPDLGTCGNHAAAVIGRRKEKDKCQYLIFNSWEVKPGDGGKQWVDADDLAKNLMEVYQLRY